MPELPEVEVILGQLRNRICGATIIDFWIGREDIIRQGLITGPWYVGAGISEIQRIGKCIVMTCLRNGHPRYLLAELGMTGLLLFSPILKGVSKHLHAKLILQGGQEPEVGYWNPRRFGRLHLLEQQQLEGFAKRRFGYDPLTVDQGVFEEFIRNSRSRIKSFLLNQHKLAGIGNIYANEILHRARVHPHARGCQLSRATVSRLYSAMQMVLKEAVSWGGSTIRDFCAPDGTPGRFQEHHAVYQKASFPCPYGCGIAIRRVTTERSSFYCPSCQQRR